MEIVVTRTIDAPAARVFQVVADIARWPKVVGAIESVEILSGEPVSVGTHFRETRRLFGRTASEDMYVAALDPPHRMLLTADSNGMHYLTEHIVEAINDTASTLTIRFKATPETLLARLMSRFTGFLAPKLEGALERNTIDIAAAAEHGGVKG